MRPVSIIVAAVGALGVGVDKVVVVVEGGEREGSSGSINSVVADDLADVVDA
jgi:hypothetical protein